MSRVGWLAGLVAVLLAAGAPGAAAQDPPPACAVAPDAIVTPEPPSDTDRLVRELRDGRIDAAASCTALVERLDRIAGSSSSSATSTAAIAGLASGAGIATTTPAGAPLPGTQTVTLADADRTWLAATGSALRGDTWFLIGLLPACLFGYLLMRRDA